MECVLFCACVCVCVFAVSVNGFERALEGAWML